MALLRWAVLCGVFMCLAGQAQADTCTLVTDFGTGRILKKDGDCERRNAPASTFKIPLSLMGFDAGILKDENNPGWPYKPEYDAWLDAWKQTITPTLWQQASVVWYSQELTRSLGEKRFKHYVNAFDYGNRDVSGDKGKNNGLTRAWLGSSLQISPVEQVAFLSRMLKRELPVSSRAVDMTMAIMPTFQAADGWTVHGKTGTAFQLSPSGTQDRNRQIGWFVGWAKKDERMVLFARLIRDEKKESGVASFRARDSLIADLPAILRQ